jgi:hypothetical protein
VVAAEPITDVDTRAADMLDDLEEASTPKAISLVFADMKDPVREKIERYELTPDHRPRALLPHRESCRGRVPGPVRADWAPPPRRVL